MKKIFLAIAASLILFALTNTPKIFIGTENQTIAVIDAAENLPLTIDFMHSVQKTPVIEELHFHDGEFVLQRTIYKSQGVGLPFDAADGNFRREGDLFIMDDMNRHFKNLELRTGKGTRLTLTVNGRKFELYKKFPVGTKIIIRKF
ncbi:MAG: DUF1850 domain-containing protein [Selenomonadaceae bacterium]|nr:DUF1850 domain-containing protein [Selenomonadaceae bacterium]